ncbi:hypothetical protein Tco_0834396 [Tanacetum coccineum]
MFVLVGSFLKKEPDRTGQARTRPIPLANTGRSINRAILSNLRLCSWDIIENGNSFNHVVRTTTNADGTPTSTIPGPVTTEEKAQKKNDLKAESVLLMALPNEHQLTFNQYKDAKTLFAAIQTRFGGNDATKKTQKTLLKQMYESKIEEMDLKWQLALLSMRARGITRELGRRSLSMEVILQDMTTMVASDGAGFDWSFMAEEEVTSNIGHLWLSQTLRRNFVPTAVLTKSGIVPVSAARPINTVAPKSFINVAKLDQMLFRSHIHYLGLELKGYLINNEYDDLVKMMYDKKELAIPGQTTTGKEFSNPLMADSLPKTILPTKFVE